MNYLAHIFLSGPDRQIRLGNFIGDAVKGNSYNDYPPAIRERYPAPSRNRRLYGPPSCVHRMCAAAQALFRTIFVHSGRHLLRLSAGVAVPGILRGAVKKIHQKLLLDDDPLSSSFAGTDQTVHVAFYRHRPPGQICFGSRHPQFTGDYGPRRPDRTSGREGRGLPGDARRRNFGWISSHFSVHCNSIVPIG